MKKKRKDSKKNGSNSHSGINSSDAANCFPNDKHHNNSTPCSNLSAAIARKIFPTAAQPAGNDGADNNGKKETAAANKDAGKVNGKKRAAGKKSKEDKSTGTAEADGSLSSTKTEEQPLLGFMIQRYLVEERKKARVVSSSNSKKKKRKKKATAALLIGGTGGQEDVNNNEGKGQLWDENDSQSAGAAAIAKTLLKESVASGDGKEFSFDNAESSSENIVKKTLKLPSCLPSFESSVNPQSSPRDGGKGEKPLTGSLATLPSPNAREADGQPMGLQKRRTLPDLMLVAIANLRLRSAIAGPSIIMLAVLIICQYKAQLREALHYPSTQHHNITTDMQNLPPPPPLGHNNTTTTRPKFDCAINWVRIPKTASSSVELVFMKPLLKSELFSTTYLIENSCLFGPGGCSTYWKTTPSLRSNFTVDADGDIPPYFGIGPRTDRRNIVNITNNLGRCFPRFNTFCYEFDRKTNTMNFGPPSKMMWKMKRNFGLKLNQLNANETSQQKEENFLKVLSNNGSYYITPTTSGHTGLDTSIFGWVLPPNPLVFSVFRDPLQRLVSSFHFGIRFGANRPGQVGLCSNKYGGKKWKESVAEALKIATTSNNTNTTMYQTMLYGYLEECSDATHNAYTRFLDPLTQNLTVALNHLESHVIVGMQSDLEETLQRWVHITLGACSKHPNYSTLNQTLTNSFKILGKKKTNENLIVKGLGRKSFPDMTRFDMDLQNLIRACIDEDEIIYKRAIGIYEEQRRWVL